MMQTLLAATAQHIGAAALLWFLAGLVGLLAASAGVVLLLQRHLLKRSQQAVPAPVNLLLWYGLGFALIAAAALLFTVIAEHIAADAAIGRFDIQLSMAIRQHTSRLGYRLLGCITHFGDSATLTVLWIAGTVLLLAQRRLLLALGWIAAIGGNSLLNPALKDIFQRVRPEAGGHAYSGWSFPSGHSSGAMVAYGMLAYVLLRSVKGAWHLPVILLAIAIIFSTGFSRIYLQAHYVSDVVAGFATGAAWLTVCISSVEFVRFRRGRRRP
ncbi:MAG TPA: phosphatase PAP2 family protein [Methylophilaceae bacterium]|nr:phosphatase PAP2 family protein [Methylophilaceae bacterium]